MTILVAHFRRFHFTNLLRVVLSLALVLATLPLQSKAQAANSANAQPDNGYKTATLPSKNLPKLDDLLRDNAPEVKKEKVKSPKLDSAARCRPYDMRCLKFWQDKGKPNDAKIGQLAPPRPSYNTFAQLLAANDVLAETRHAWQNVSDVPFGLNLMRPAPKAAAAPMMMQSSWPVYSNLYTELAQRRNQQGTGGEDLYSGNYNWSLPIVGLPGRAGHDLGLSLSYNSHVWVRTDTGMRMVDYMDWYSEPGFGFSVGLPRLNSFQHAARGSSVVNAFLLTLSSGRAIELIRKSNSASLGVFESMDGSLIRMIIEYGPNKQHVFFPDGTKLEYQSFQCQTIRDRNGNQLTVTYHATYGLMTKITDTLGRDITFHYLDQYGVDIDQPRQYQGYFSLSHIKQWRKNEAGTAVQVTLANFGYENIAIYTNFQNLLSEVPNGTLLPMCTKVVLADGSLYKFAYTTYGQVKTISHYAPKVPTPDQNNLCPQTETVNCHYRLLSTINYNLPNGMTTDPQQPDCPRFTTRTDWAFEWNNGVTTQFQPGPGNAWWQVTAPDNTKLRQFFYVSTSSADLWQDGLPTQTKAYSDTQDPNNVNTVPKRTTSTAWEYNTNYGPRPLSASITDGEISSNRYTAYVYPATFSYNLPIETYQYNGTSSSGTLLRKATTSYLLSSPYVVNSGGISGQRRIIGLPSEQKQYDGANTLLSKVSYQYDQSGYLEHQLPASGTISNHDTTNFGASFVLGRGNVTSVTRWDATNETSTTNAVTTSTRYNTTGSVIGQVLPPNNQSGLRETRIIYTDVFSDSTVSNTLAYPTKIVDPDAYAQNSANPSSYTSLKYRYDIGATTYSQAPKMLATDASKWIVKTYDEVGRLKQVDNQVNNGYTRFAYDTALHYTQVFAKTDAPSYTVPGVGQTGSVLVTESFETTLYDGHGRARAKVTPHPGSIGGLRSTYQVYDAMGRVAQASNPTEIDVNWNPTGDDAGVYRWSLQTYDWKGRPVQTTNQDGTTRSVSYNGCGCTGSETITTTDEVNRQQRITRDAYLDSTTQVDKVELLNANGTTYSTTATVTDSLNRKAFARTYDGPTTSYTACNAGNCRESETKFDGFGRALQKSDPLQSVYDAQGTLTAKYYTNYEYYADNTLKKTTDARGATATMFYNLRGLATNVNYAAPAGITVPSNVIFEYDEGGNRKKMTDSIGYVDYTYTGLSQMQSEKRKFTALTGTYDLNYQYDVQGNLTQLGYSSTMRATWQNFNTNYSYNLAGSLTAVTGTPFAGESTFANNFQYRAWGAAKSYTYGQGGVVTANYNTRLQVNEYKALGIPIPTGTTTMIWGQYNYDSSGQIKYAQDKTNGDFDRAYLYDHIARLKEAATGPEARDMYNGTSGGQATGPFRHSYTWNVWSYQAAQNGRFWTQPQSISATFKYARKDGWQYDADGRVTSDGTNTYYFNAAGQGHKATATDALGQPTTPEQWYDGNGRVGKRDPNTGFMEYYVLSSVLGGKLVAELDGQQGDRKGAFVYAGGKRLARLIAGLDGTNQYVYYEVQDPITGKAVSGNKYTNQYGTYFLTMLDHEPNPDGINVGPANPFVGSPPPVDPEEPSLFGGGGSWNPNSPQFYLDGIRISEEFGRQLLSSPSGSVLIDIKNSDRIALAQVGILGHWEERKFDLNDTPPANAILKGIIFDNPTESYKGIGDVFIVDSVGRGNGGAQEPVRLPQARVIGPIIELPKQTTVVPNCAGKIINASGINSPAPKTAVPALLSVAKEYGFNLEETAYLLATAHRETRLGVFMTELGRPDYFNKYEPGTKLGIALGNSVKGDGARFKGRGFVQVTGRRNYQDWTDRTGTDFISEPTLMANPEAATRIAVIGMQQGTFTGKDIGSYINWKGADFFNARRVINGLDHAGEIAGYARQYLAILEGCYDY